MEKLMHILIDLHPDVDFKKEDKLIQNGILDSFDIITTIAEINDIFDINVDISDIMPENMNSAAAMWNMVQRYL